MIDSTCYSEVENYTWDDVEFFLHTAAQKLNKLKIDLVYGVPRGGVVASVILSHLLNVPVIFGQSLSPLIKNTTLLIVDDVFDSGRTMMAYIDFCNHFEVNVITLCFLLKLNSSEFLYICDCQ